MDKAIYEFSPSAQESLATIGALVFYWNMAEQFFSGILTNMLGLPPHLTHVITRNYGNVGIVNAIEDLSKLMLLEDCKTRSAISYACKHYDGCRSNRNQIVHNLLNFEDESISF